LLRRQTNGDYNALEILHDLIVGKPQHAISAGSKPLIASCIVTEAGLEIVTFAIDFDNELAGMRDEIGDVVTHRALSAKAEPGEPVCLQVTPQQGFGASHRAS
jgi:hypothetical protein